MEKNVGTADKIVRLVLAAATVWLAVRYSYWWLIATVLLVYTVLASRCWPYTWFGINTRKKEV
ncbi:DUF2892 domain-containing protein [Candidatus Woesearchaeota archaeon]|nr:DUF2892 domain-containing protein [Candidatus Woesearchaeota archaeon]MBW3017375.1 DUF2892 domain-containing protein [Candidatus Woesearchaeota archaeon]